MATWSKLLTTATADALQPGLLGSAGPDPTETTLTSFDGQREGLRRDDVLDNVTLFWPTNTGVSAARLYRENNLGFVTPKNVTMPVVVSAFPDELYQAPWSWAERTYPNLIHYNKLEKGGHFAAWEQSELLNRRCGRRSGRSPERAAATLAGQANS